jgi:hypothetical protein
MKLEFSRQIFGKKHQASRFIKMRPVIVKLFHTDGWTNMTKLTVAFLNFANAPKNGYLHEESNIAQNGVSYT